MKNNKGFSLVELLAAITIMGILMIVAIPTMINLIEQNKNQDYVDDAKKLVALAKQRIRQDATVFRPTKNGSQYWCIAFKFSSISKEGEIEKGPEGGTYDLEDDSILPNSSFVIVRYDNTKDKLVYGVQLVEKYTDNKTNSYKGLKFVEDESVLSKKNASSTYVTTDRSSFIKVTSMSATAATSTIHTKSRCNKIVWY